MNPLNANINELEGGKTHGELPFPIGQPPSQVVSIGGEFALPSGRRTVHVPEILLEHPVGIELGGQRLHGLLDRRQPFDRNTRGISVVKCRYHHVFQDIVQGLAVLRIGIGGGVLIAFQHGSDRPAVGAVVSLHPPAVGNAHIEDTVDHHLHPAGPAGLKWATGVVEPQIDALDQMAGDPDVVILQEEDPSPEAIVPADPHDLFHEMLADAVVGVGLAGKHQMDGPVGMVNDPVQTIQVREDHVRPLVRGETPGNADHQRSGIQSGKEFFPPDMGRAILGSPFGDVFPDQVDGLLFQFIAHPPEEGVGDVLDAAPPLGVG